jgi:hypothetical protein
VGQLLKNHNVRVAVLNSCESAKANRGDEANLAKLLAKEGIKNVLAMSYKTLSSAATRFMHTFYHSLISNGNPFSFAVRDARQDLGIHSTRRARFGLTRSLQDWIVPVVYACGEDLKIQISSLEQTKNERPTFIDISDHVSPHLKLVGRDFDVLRFERLSVYQGLRVRARLRLPITSSNLGNNRALLKAQYMSTALPLLLPRRTPSSH